MAGEMAGLESALRDGIQRLRGDKRQEELAIAARDCGIEWNRATVAAIELGRRHLTLEEVLLLPLVLSRMTGRAVRLEDILGDVERIELTPNASAPVSLLPKMLAGTVRVVDLPDIDIPLQRERAEMGAHALRVLKELKPLWPEANVGQLWAAEADASREVEQRAADRLGCPPVALSVLAHRTWGHGFTEERDRRARSRVRVDASPQSLRTLGGHVTRELLEELAPIVEEERHNF